MAESMVAAPGGAGAGMEGGGRARPASGVGWARPGRPGKCIVPGRTQWHFLDGWILVVTQTARAAGRSARLPAGARKPTTTSLDPRMPDLYLDSGFALKEALVDPQRHRRWRRLQAFSASSI